MTLTKELLDKFEKIALFDDSYYLDSFESESGIKWPDMKKEILENIEFRKYVEEIANCEDNFWTRPAIRLCQRMIKDIVKTQNDDLSPDAISSKRAIDLQFQEGQFVERIVTIVEDSTDFDYVDKTKLREKLGDYFREMRGIKD